MDRVATCHCGDLRLACAGEPMKVSMCHCAECQRRTGSAFSVAVFYARAAVTANGAPAGRYERASASGQPVSFRFCPRCGTNLWWEPARLPALIGVALGGFADPDFPEPSQSVWTRDMHRWLSLPPQIIPFAEAPVR